VGDKAPDDKALAKAVDRLLQSPSFGGRWGRLALLRIHRNERPALFREIGIEEAERVRWLDDSDSGALLLFGELLVDLAHLRPVHLVNYAPDKSFFGRA
jgi:hypothetical protein